MLKRFRVNNFRSLLNVEFRPAGVNVLIGPNNAGKTNLCAALRFLGLTASQPLEDAIRASVGETWNIRNVYAPDQNVQFEVECSLPHEAGTIDFDYSLSLAVRAEPPTFQVSEEILKVTGGGFTQQEFLANRRGEAWLLDEECGRKAQPDFTRHDMFRVPLEATMLHRLYEREANQYANLFKKYLQNWSYYNLSPASLRSPEVVREAAGLRCDGGNLTRTFFLLHNEEPRVEGKLIEIIRALEPRLNVFTYAPVDPAHVYLYMKDDKGNRFSTQSLSDGTLRFMAMVYLLLAGEDSTDGSFPRLTTIEEPENGLYVGELKPLFERLTTRGHPHQFIFTTHSPYFIDLFDSCLEGVHVMKPGVPSSEIKKPDVDRTRKLLDEMPLGEMHFREMLG